jgi:apolipoprotein N-acyltransferase
MPRGVIYLLTTIVGAAVFLYLGGVVVEPLGDELQQSPAADANWIDSDSFLSDLYTIMFQWITLLMMGVGVLVAVVYAIRKRRFAGVRR